MVHLTDSTNVLVHSSLCLLNGKTTRTYDNSTNVNRSGSLVALQLGLSPERSSFGALQMVQQKAEGKIVVPWQGKDFYVLVTLDVQTLFNMTTL